ncbi:bifunctional DedA family/phosphatase PAP2 family protein [Halovibrio sp. HP20-50]|uniref:bifunctional DedA family/phosphatase PAP2 family protein n=1 Tax=Halovibrio sp. HP20-59 TaxID=3080275 RepID=UPI00294B1430|nr:bifunctional DedA family/phosphatase PAP2 family protein [Halovibrio sp. HP20-59]MEA2119306.1 bifunctional DedA family/phosphatase PAP2 family protein [Halovibrio sp. HP20-59]
MPYADTLSALTLSPLLLLCLVMVIALVESLALVGLLVPGVMLITTFASLAGHQDIALAWLIGVAFIGAVIGDGISFALGFQYRQQVTQRWPLSQHPEWLGRGARFFERYGIWSVFIGRFVGPIRPIIPLVAGMMHMSPSTFLCANLSSAALWAPAYILPGYLLGRTWQQHLNLPPGLEAALLTLAFIIIVLAIIFSWGRHQASRHGKLYRAIAGSIRRLPLLRRPWLAMSQTGDVPLASLLLLVLALGSLSGWTLLVIAHQGPLEIDLFIQQLSTRLQSDVSYLAGNVFARIGDTLGIIALTLPWAAWMLITKRWAVLLHWCGAFASVALLNIVGKGLFGRARPETPDYLMGSYSYPSAHTSTAVVLFGLTAAFVAAEISRQKRFWVYWLALALALPMALSRLVVGVHWFSDLVGGALLGLVVCALTRLHWQQQPRSPLRPCPWPLLSVASLVLISARVGLLPPV